MTQPLESCNTGCEMYPVDCGEELDCWGRLDRALDADDPAAIAEAVITHPLSSHLDGGGLLVAFEIASSDDPWGAASMDLACVFLLAQSLITMEELSTSVG